MQARGSIAIKTHFLNKRIKELALKRSWIAKKLGVDPKTVTRWTTGKVKRVSIDRIENLAKIIECRVEELVDKEDIFVLGTDNEKDFAIESIISKDLLLLLSPTENWELVESIIKSAISPNTNKKDIGKLYNLLSITKWRMGDYETGLIFANKALEVGQEVEDKGVYLKGLFNKATIFSMIGKNTLALQFFQECLSMKEYFSKSSDIASLYTNLSMVYRDFANFNEGIRYQKKAIKMFSKDNKYYNLAIAYQCLGFIYTEIGDFEMAIDIYDEAIRCAERSNYEKGITIITLYKLDSLVLSDKQTKINTEIEGIIGVFLKGDQADPFCYEFIARYYRFFSNTKRAMEVIKIGISKSDKSLIVKASLWHEAARIALAEKDYQKELLYRENGNKLYSKLELYNRIINGQVKEYGGQFLNNTIC
ncbi:tetratricopeptide repeat protein [Alkaliphilus pronyensis]|uniref:Tetratricopeptide repeat protein n=1 Tax=Alkaliphilus pronyensis TaxID=1482732 RepID=A0A6I0FEV4_9FIRM|nr:tetratricopeptide repeat protein [Alkaliphilus pronyensis]KAB3537737.1 tetratricopeptide repeat protein [Alkaliphilus pronyensis]